MDSFINNPKEISWPVEVGYYWFYGYRYYDPRHEDKKELIFVKVFAIANGLMTVGDGQMFYKSEVHEAQFIPATLPEFPQ